MNCAPGPLGTQTPSEDPWDTCPHWVVWAPWLAASVAVQAVGFFLALPDALRLIQYSVAIIPLLPAGTVWCTDRSYSSCATLCRAPNKAAYGQRWPVQGFQQPQRLGGLRSVAHLEPIHGMQLGHLGSFELLSGRNKAILFLFYFLNLCPVVSLTPSSFTSCSKHWLKDWGLSLLCQWRLGHLQLAFISPGWQPDFVYCSHPTVRCLEYSAPGSGSNVVF